jgi:hypothetical protein
VSAAPRRPLAALAVLALAFASAAHGQAETVRPGYWEATSRVLSPIPSVKTERRCIAAQDVTRFMSCYINHHYTCVCPDQSYSGGKIRFHGVCTDRKGAKVGIRGEGDYTPTALHMSATVTFRLAGLPIEGEAATDAHRIADDCPAPEPRRGAGL